MSAFAALTQGSKRKGDVFAAEAFPEQKKARLSPNPNACLTTLSLPDITTFNIDSDHDGIGSHDQPCGPGGDSMDWAKTEAPTEGLTSSQPSGSPNPTLNPGLIDICFGSIDIRLQSASGFNNVQKDRQAKLTIALGSTLTLSTTSGGKKCSYIGIIPADTAATIQFVISEFSAQIEPYIPSQELQTEDDSQLLVCLHVYGNAKDADDLGKYLREKNVFLQDPIKLRKSIKYLNPQAWPVPDEIQRLLVQEHGMSIQEEFKRHENEIANIFEESSVPPIEARDGLLHGFQISDRVTNTLFETQLEAVHYMICKERNPWSLPTLWRKLPTTGFYQSLLTDRIFHEPPPVPRGGILADEMGLGKSLTALALIASSLDYPNFEESLYTVKTTLIVAPTITMVSWREQIERHTSGLKVLFYVSRKSPRDSFASYDIVITTYGMITSERRGLQDLQNESIQNTDWFRIILDEAHTIRRRTASQSQLIYNLKSQRRWCLTGTPTQNRLDDLGSLLQFLGLNPIDTRKEFNLQIIKPLRQGCGLDNLRHVIAATTLRRVKNKLTQESLLPDRKDLVERLSFNPDELKLYNFISSETRRQIQKALDSGSCSIRIASQYLIRLRQVCNANALLPQHILQSFGDEIALGAGGELPITNVCENCGNEIENKTEFENRGCEHLCCYNCSIDRNHCPLCYSAEDLDLTSETSPPTIETSRSPCGSRSRTPILPAGGSKSASSTKSNGRSSKVTAIVNNLLKAQIAPERPKRMLDLLGEALTEEGIKYARLDGSMNLSSRITEINRFRNHYNINVLLITIGSGCVGLDLTAASEVHLVEPQYNPMQEEQALARVHRIGQKNAVTTIRYIIEGTYEQEIQKLQEEKMELAELCSGEKDGRARLLALKAVLK